ncbi:MAG: hypothetical protein GEU79_03190 [Acidimicrobiia bacterium]|nr:hypothetical protein [Acidimicrobiia bacterium]
MAFVEVRARSVEEAVEAALSELSISRDQAEISVLEEPQKGFLGIGGRDALVKVSVKEDTQTSSRSGRRRGGRSKGKRGQGGGRSQQGDGRGQKGGGRSQSRNKEDNSSGRERSRNGGDRNQQKSSNRGQGRGGQQNRGKGVEKRDKKKMQDDRPQLSTAEQAPIVKEFLEGLLGVMNLEGSVVTSVEDDVIVASVEGDQTQALVGQRGSGINAIHEVTKTVLLRHSADVGRLRLDIAGYQERRREALSIYANQLIDQVLAEGGEIILEPMSAADRKVVHDAAGSREGVISYSEGESPRRFVVLANEEGDDSEEE